MNLQVSAPADAVRVRVTRPGLVLLDGVAADVVDTAVGDGTDVTYEAVAYDAAGNASPPATATVSTPDRTPPAVPTAPTGSGWPLTVAWPAVPGAAQYALRRDGTPLAGGGGLRSHGWRRGRHRSAGRTGGRDGTADVDHDRPRHVEPRRR